MNEESRQATAQEPLERAPVRIAVIGAGRHARALLIPAIQLSTGVRLVALATAHEASAAEAQAQFGLPTYVGPTAILERADIDAVVIATPGPTQAPLTTQALRAGKHVYCETPGLTDTDDVTMIEAALVESGRILSYGTHLRYAPIYQKMLHLIPDVRANDAVTISIRFYSWVRHMYDLALYLLGDVTSVTGYRQAGQVLALLHFASGDLGFIHAGGPASIAIPLEAVEVCGPGGIIAARDGKDLTVYRNIAVVGAHEIGFESASSTSWAPTFSIPYRGLVGFALRGYIPAIENFALSIRRGQETRSGLDQAERTLRLERAIAQAVARKKEVTIETSLLLSR